MTKIMVIEDQKHLLDFLVKVLKVEGFEVISANNGVDGTRLIEENLPDLILCDISMPGLDGYGVLVTVRSKPETSLIPFMFLTAHTARDQLRYGMELGADDYITKPVSRAELLAAIRARLEKQAALQREYQSRVEQLRGEISVMLPHELRTPLTGILGFSELLIADCDVMSPIQIREFAENIRDSCRRLNRLVENYLMYAQLEILRTDPDRILELRRQHLTDPDTVIQGVIKERAEVYRRPADLWIACEPAPLNIARDTLRKLAEELADNAFKFSPPNSPVRVTGEVVEGHYRLCVADRGRGMTPQQIESIGAYQQFERRVYEQQGSGLGLALVRRLAELHGGKLQLESAAGRGTTACVILPVKPL